MDKSLKHRAISTPSVRAERQKLLKLAHSRISISIKSGFYLEAIALIESVFADRLESAIAYFSEEDVNHLTVNQAVVRFRLLNIEFGDSKLLEEIAAWGRGRSRWIHEFAKVSENDDVPWDERISEAAKIAKAGKVLLDRFIAEVRKIS